MRDAAEFAKHTQNRRLLARLVPFSRLARSRFSEPVVAKAKRRAEVHELALVERLHARRIQGGLVAEAEPEAVEDPAELVADPVSAVLPMRQPPSGSERPIERPPRAPAASPATWGSTPAESTETAGMRRSDYVHISDSRAGVAQ